MVSIVDLTVTLERDVTVEEVNNAFREAAAAGPLKGILGYSDEPLVSSDYQGDPRSSIIDGLSTLVIGGNMVKTPDTREGGGEAEPVNMEAGCVGLQYTIQLQLAVLFMVAMALAI